MPDWDWEERCSLARYTAGVNSAPGGTGGVNSAAGGTAGVNSSAGGTAGVNSSAGGTAGVNSAPGGTAGVNSAAGVTAGVNSAAGKLVQWVSIVYVVHQIQRASRVYILLASTVSATRANSRFLGSSCSLDDLDSACLRPEPCARLIERATCNISALAKEKTEASSAIIMQDCILK